MYLMFGPDQRMGYVDFFNPSTNRLVPAGTGLTWTAAAGFKGNGTGYLDMPVNLQTMVPDVKNCSFMAWITGKADTQAHSGVFSEFLNTGTASNTQIAWWPATTFLGEHLRFGFGVAPVTGRFPPSQGNLDGELDPGWFHLTSYCPVTDASRFGSSVKFMETFVVSGKSNNTFGPIEQAAYTGFPTTHPVVASGNEGLRFMAIAPFWHGREGRVFNESLLAPLMTAFS